MRYGMTIPLDGVPLHEQRSFFEELCDRGYTDLWTAEAGGTIVKEPFSFPGGRRFHFADPSGNELAVWAFDATGV